VEHRVFQRFVIVLIVINAVTLGMQTSHAVVAQAGGLLNTIDHVVLGIFVVELLLRLYAHGWRFFTDPWSVFDFVIVVIALVPSAGALSVLRTLRVLRVLRLVSMVPSMRRVVAGLLTAVPGMASVAALLALVLFVAGVMATKMFGTLAPEEFGDLGSSLFTLFQTMTGEGWPDIARTVMAQEPAAWIFFVVYILVSSFAVLNLFIAVVVSGMEQEVTNDMVRAEEKNAERAATADRQILDELRALRAEVAALRALHDNS
jgi:voltage-gated sodium channel